MTTQWFVRALDFKAPLLAAGERITWHPAHMGARYREWVENLRWDWCISRQRYFGVPFPVWYCDCLRRDDPGRARTSCRWTRPRRQPTGACACGGTSFTPERDVMDTWATSSMSPQIVGQCFDDPELYAAGVSRSALRPQAHEIIRTWAFYTIVKSLPPLRRAAVDERGDLRLGAGRRGHGQDQQEPWRRADGADWR